MKLPNNDRAIIDIRKLTGYVLNPDHPTGADKSYLFDRTLGITPANAKLLAEALRKAVIEYDAEVGELDEFGQRYRIDFPLRTIKGEAIIRSGWMIRHDEDFPRFITCFIRK